MREATDVYVLDHPSGYEWRYELGDLLQELYEAATWNGKTFTDEDGVYIVPVPAHECTDDVTEYMESEDWLALGGRLIWKPRTAA